MTRNKKRSKLGLYGAGIALLVIFGGFTVTKFASAVTPYVDYESARATERTVQVAGGLLQGSSSYDMDAGQLHFTLIDTEDTAARISVRYEGLKPANFEDAVSIVAIGRYDPTTEQFAANELLVKCPSKYQGIEGYEEKQYGAGDEAASYGDRSYG
ncbi:MAG: cytochrome c maturation protein CcmE [Thermoanaerobaculia bacterium]|nr:cytochrome c maturation protein CcmE [Thermoanaerobaculia bacterium]